ncbi:MAG: hypothetical protein Kow0090_16050 [Myxococcota bacterium]
MGNGDSLTRRAFFREAIGAAIKSAAEAFSATAKRVAPPLFIRPPGALPEPEFLLLCNRCGECEPACPHKAIELLPSSAGASAGTPAIMPSRQPCLICDGFPCAKTCEPKALAAPASKQEVKIGVAKVDESLCLSAQSQECDYCERECRRRKKAITLVFGSPPKIDLSLCDGCGLCEYICPAPDKPAIHILPFER